VASAERLEEEKRPSTGTRGPLFDLISDTKYNRTAEKSEAWFFLGITVVMLGRGHMIHFTGVPPKGAHGGAEYELARISPWLWLWV
jgi:hypothetical protein